MHTIVFTLLWREALEEIPSPPPVEQDDYAIYLTLTETTEV